MRNFIPALFILCNASIAMAQSGPGEESSSTSLSSQRVVLEALNYSATHPSLPQAPVAAAQPMTSGIGPSSNMPEPGDYGYSVSSDLRQLNF